MAFGSSAVYFNDSRWQRQPAESIVLGRIFRVREGMSLYIRTEFQNIFNRLFFTRCPATADRPPSPNGGSPGSGGAMPRAGQIVARFAF
jgi:hypothetical protein